MKLRHYQKAAIDSIYRYFETNSGNCLVVMATGTGKSFVIAKFIEETIAAWPDTRIINATHSRDLVSQNCAEFLNLCPFANAGIYSAGLKSRNTTAQVLFCGIQSVYNKACDLQRCDLLIIDEAQSVSEEDDTMWRGFISDMLKINPKMKIIGLTATDYRMKSGLLTTGENAFFTDVVYEYGILNAINDGYLCPVIPKTMATKYDIASLSNKGADYTQKELDRVFNIDDLTKKALDEVEAYGADRKSWLIFAASVDHAEAIHSELQRRGYSGACVTQKISDDIRDRAIRDMKSESIRYLVNRYIFTVGSNIPNIDLIADFGKTKSPGLHVQKLGRGTRLFPGKKNCVVLDFADNIGFHGPLDRIRGRDKNSGGGGGPPVKICPGTLDSGEACGCRLFTGIRKCYVCGYEFEREGPDIRSDGGNAAVLSTQSLPEWHKVLEWGRRKNHKNPDKPPTMLVTYWTLNGKYYDTVCFDHKPGSYPHKKAVAWHNAFAGNLPMPENVNAGVDCKFYQMPSRILVKPDGEFWRVVQYDFSHQEENAPQMVDSDDDFEIPF